MTSSAKQIRAYVNEAFIEPARRAGLSETSVTAGDIHKDLRLLNRMPAVCSAIDSKKFQDQFGVAVRQRTGPRQGSTATWVLSLPQ